jgi:hypothetical protein
MSDTEDRWYVNVGSDDVRMMTLDELVDAFENGVITRETLVVEVGGNEWQPLKDVADLGEEEPVPAAAPVSSAAPTARNALPTRPVAAAKPAVQASWPPQAVSRESAWPPAAAWDSVAPAAAPKQLLSSAPLSAVPNSTIPVVQDLDLDFPEQSFKSGGKKKVAVFAALAVAVVGGIGFAATQSGGPVSSPVPVPAAAPKLPDPTPTPYSKPAAEETTTTTTASTEAKDSEERLSDEQKKALLSADKDRDSKKRSRAVSAPRSGGGSRAPSGGGNAVFKASGNANDPLNPTL